MRSEFRYSSFLVVLALLLGFGASSAAQQIRFEDFSNASYADKYLNQNYSWQSGNLPYLTTYQGNSVLRLTDGQTGMGIEASTMYFKTEQPVTNGFTTYFQFQTHNPTGWPNAGDGIAFIIQKSTSTDSTMCASGVGLSALGAGGADCPAQAGAMGYAGINNSLVVEFDIRQDAWDPNANHIAVQSCGPPTEDNQNYNTPVHDEGTYQIGNNANVTSCLYMGGINSQVPQISGTCNELQRCQDGMIHQVAMQYTPGTLKIWLDSVNMATHQPEGPPTLAVSVTLEQEIQLDPNCTNGAKCAWVGFTASQPSQGTAQDILVWEFTPAGAQQIQQPIQNGGIPTFFGFGSHQTTVQYPSDFVNMNNIQMTVVATPTDRLSFYQNRLLGTGFANEQCIEYLGTSGGSQLPEESGECIVYSYSCQDSTGQNQVMCPPADMGCSPQQESACIAIDTSYYTLDNLTKTNTDYLENDMIGDNNWMSIFTGYQSDPTDGTTSGGSRGFGGSGSKLPTKSTFFTGGSITSDIVATFCPNQPRNGLSGCSSSLSRMDESAASAADEKVRIGAAQEGLKVGRQK